MKLLIVAATETEIVPFKEWLSTNIELNADILVTGVGMVATTYTLTHKLALQRYDLVINVGIAGTFNTEIKLGEVVEVVEDRISELGVENKEEFQTAFEIGLISENQHPYTNGTLPAMNKFNLNLKKCSGITVNKVHGNKNSIEKIINLVNPDVESMEGAAVFYTCIMKKIACCQIRAISNRVEERNKENWNIPKAISNLNIELIRVVNQLNK